MDKEMTELEKAAQEHKRYAYQGGVDSDDSFKAGARWMAERAAQACRAWMESPHGETRHETWTGAEACLESIQELIRESEGQDG